MAPSALLPDDVSILPSKTSRDTDPKFIPEPASGFILKRGTTEYNDFRDDLARDGYVVVKNAIPRERALEYQQKAFDWMASFDLGLDISNPDTWLKKHLPVQSKISTFHAYAVSHEKFMWDARMEPGVIEAFTKIWGTDELLVSFDALNVTLPNRKDVPRKTPWEHVDQSPLRRGLHCVQGIINLSTAGDEDGGLTVYPGSHLYTEEFFDTQTDSNTWKSDDYYPFAGASLDFFKEKGLKPLKVNAEPGDLILWDSRTIHYGAEPTETSNTIRTVIYAAYTPARFATEEALKTKAEIFSEWGGTTHWPHDNIAVRRTKPIREDGTLDPKDRSEPIEKPEKTDALLKLAGIIPY
ncbi:phytanoyl-CoA dioxygenase [Phlyctema vagabunda]|uniref:Phytanoyl-CoA dioxygenase n=1 Tax=Phlyctema vagabunda TaxID=108571 RepID=A0ABR4PDG6_9HELO